MDGSPAEISKAFSIKGSVTEAKPFGSGHIHDTYRVLTSAGGEYILQRINDVVFPDVEGLQENIRIVTGHLYRRLSAIPGSYPARQSLTTIMATGGRGWYRAEDGSYWRMFLFIADHHNYDTVKNESLAFEGGRAVGRFTALVSDLSPALLKEIIPGFHNTPARIEAFRRVLDADPAGRAASVRTETEKILARTAEMHQIVRLGEEGLIPLRVTHNDTKFNNILFDGNDKALCMIDLDTVMPGYVHYDFGDAIRTAAATAPEDEADLGRMGIDMKLFRAWTGGFLAEAGDILTATEKKWLAFAPRLITCEQALRFLTDHINGDSYYKIRFPGHNLQRARAQIKLLESMEANAAAMESVVTNC